LAEVHAVVHEIGASKERVLLMPEGVDPAVLAGRGRWLVEICKQEGFRFSPRLHIELWGNRRGV
jgi:7-carboxy-7-deazaguanine synthase